MPTTLQHREVFNAKLAKLVDRMGAWECKDRVSDDEVGEIRSSMRCFNHRSVSQDEYLIGGVDGSGDYPSLTYADSFVFLANASGTVYRTDSLHGLKEVSSVADPNLELVWLPSDREAAVESWSEAFENLAGAPVPEIVASSDYKDLKRSVTHQKQSVNDLIVNLILPAASDTANVGIQLRSAAELGAAYRMISHSASCRFVLMDTTLALPMVTRRDLSLFYEHLKRLCCVTARAAGVVFLTISKSHGLPSMDLIEGIAADVCGTAKDKAEHWFWRLPIDGVDNWRLSLLENRTVPPVGAVSYLVRFHKNTPVLRIDMDRQLWEAAYRYDSDAEAEMFAQLDYASHDQRAYGYPYPIKACHDRVRLSMGERTALKKQIIEAAVAGGMKRSLFDDVSRTTGHV